MATQEFSAFVEAASDAGSLVAGDLVPVVRGGTTYSTDATALGGSSAGDSVLVHHSANQSINTASATTLTWDTEDHDTNALHSTVTNPERLTCQTTGKYLVDFHGLFGTDATGIRYAGLYKNGVTPIAFDMRPAITGFNTSVSITKYVSLTATDYLTIQVYQNSGSTLTLNRSADSSAYFGMQQVA
jgi:hypothetical protein